MGVVVRHLNPVRRIVRCAAGASCLVATLGSWPAVLAASDDTVLEEVLVFARGEAQIGTARAASEGAVGGADLSVRPLLRVAELLEVVPGMIAVQHSGSGKANQYFLRGFNLDHGTDFTSYIDDVPMNLRSHGHGQGYLDVNALIPESVERIDYRKGAYRADVGDFSMAGASFMSTTDHMEPFVAAESGTFGWRRLAAGASARLGEGEVIGVAQWKTYDGPWELPEDLQHQSVWAKYLQEIDAGKIELSLSGYHGRWRPTEQIPERAIGTNVCENRFCSLDPTATGETLRWIASARLLADQWRATMYAQYYDWSMLSNPTYDYQINQFDRRWIAGGRFEREMRVRDGLDLTSGVELRYDDIGNVGLQHTDAGQYVEALSRHAVREGSAGIYAEAHWRATERLGLLAGLRADRYEFDVLARMEDMDAGSTGDDAVSPKLGLAYRASDRVELYANWGRGFHSNDARGVVNMITPVRGVSTGSGEEVGGRLELGAFNLSGALWRLDLDSELMFVGDSNSVEPGAATRRRGYELVAFWRPLPWMAVDAVWTGSRARYVDGADGVYVAGAIENAGELGASFVRSVWELSLRVRHLGEYPMVEDNSVRADAETSINLRGAWKRGALTIYAELLNAFDARGKDIAYYYETNVAGLDPPGEQVEGRVSRAEEPRTVRIGVKYSL